MIHHNFEVAFYKASADEKQIKICDALLQIFSSSDDIKQHPEWLALAGKAKKGDVTEISTDTSMDIRVQESPPAAHVQPTYATEGHHHNVVAKMLAEFGDEFVEQLISPEFRSFLKAVYTKIHNKVSGTVAEPTPPQEKVTGTNQQPEPTPVAKVAKNTETDAEPAKEVVPKKLGRPKKVTEVTVEQVKPVAVNEPEVTTAAGPEVVSVTKAETQPGSKVAPNGNQAEIPVAKQRGRPKKVIPNPEGVVEQPGPEPEADTKQEKPTETVASQKETDVDSAAQANGTEKSEDPKTEPEIPGKKERKKYQHNSRKKEVVGIKGHNTYYVNGLTDSPCPCNTCTQIRQEAAEKSNEQQS